MVENVDTIKKKEGRGGEWPFFLYASVQWHTIENRKLSKSFSVV